MNLKTLDKNHAIHILNILSMILAWGVSCYFFDTVATNHTVKVIIDVLMSPVYFADFLFNLFSNQSVSGHFSLMFVVLWLTYAAPFIACHPLLMVRNHDVSELRDWYLSKSNPIG